jgi:hypothetical protein
MSWACCGSCGKTDCNHPKEMSKEDRAKAADFHAKMGDVHVKMGECLKDETKSMDDCHKMMKDSKDAMPMDDMPMSCQQNHKKMKKGPKGRGAGNMPPAEKVETK